MNNLKWNHVLILLFAEKFEWIHPEWEGLVARYEHSAFVPQSKANQIIIFGGAQQTNNLNDIQILDISEFF